MGGNFNWTGFPPGESEKEMVDRLYKEQEKKEAEEKAKKMKVKRDKGFYGHCKCQTLF